MIEDTKEAHRDGERKREGGRERERERERERRLTQTPTDCCMDVMSKEIR